MGPQPARKRIDQKASQRHDTARTSPLAERPGSSRSPACLYILGLNEKVKLRGRPVRRYVAESRNGGPVNFNALFSGHSPPQLLPLERRKKAPNSLNGIRGWPLDPKQLPILPLYRQTDCLA